MEKKHIAMFISSLDKGGSERVLVNLAEYFYGRGYAVTIVTQYRAENEYGISRGIRRIFSELPENEKAGWEIFGSVFAGCAVYGRRSGRT